VPESVISKDQKIYNNTEGSKRKLFAPATRHFTPPAVMYKDMVNGLTSEAFITLNIA
jgi:hypothetical protein